MISALLSTFVNSDETKKSAFAQKALFPEVLLEDSR
jgi:hypothetical protein